MFDWDLLPSVSKATNDFTYRYKCLSVPLHNVLAVNPPQIHDI